MEKETVKVFDLQAAFKALDEIEAPKTKGLKSTRVDLKERFSAKDATTVLVEDYYSVTTHEALEEAQEDRDAEVAKAKLARIEKIVDLDAETEDDLLPSYVGKVIIQCPQCMTLFYKKPEDIEHSEENPDVVNINEVCQHCGNISGYTVIGKVDSVKEDEASEFEIPEEENELDLDFPEATEETSPEGTGGGFEDELNLEIEDSGSEDELDLNLDEVELEPTEESLKITEAKEDSDSSDADETEVTVTLGEIKDVAEEAGKAIVNAEVEEKEDVKEVTDKVVEKEVEVKETLTESLTEDVGTVWGVEIYDIHDNPEYEDFETEEEAEARYEEVVNELNNDLDSSNISVSLYKQVGDDEQDIEYIKGYSLADHPENFSNYTIWVSENGEETNKQEREHVLTKQALGEILKYLYPLTPEQKAKVGLNWISLDEEGEEGDILVSVYDPDERAREEIPETDRIMSNCAECEEYIKKALSEDLKADKPIEEEKKVCPNCGKEICECGDKKLAENEEGKNGKCEKPLEECGEKQLTEAPQTPDEIEKILMDVAASFDEGLEECNKPIKEEGVSNGEFHKMINSEVWKDFDEDLKEDIEEVKAKLPEYCDALEHAGEDAAKELEAEKAAEVEAKVEEPLNQDFPEPEIEKEPAVEESLNEAKVGTMPSSLPWWIHVMDDEVEEDYTGTPEIRTTHLEYEDKDPADEKAVLPDNLGEELEEHIQDKPAPVEDTTVIQGGDNAVVDCQTEHKIIAHSEDEKPLDCNMEKAPLEEPVAGEKVDVKVNEDIKTESCQDEDCKEEEKKEEGLTTDLGSLQTPELHGLPKLEELEDFNEALFDKSVNEFLKEVYENVNEYKTNSCELKEGKIFIEGTILFNSGRAKKTIFEFLPVKEELGSLILEGYNKDLTEEKAFTLKGALESGNHFITESFGYKYTINETLVEGLK